MFAQVQFPETLSSVELDDFLSKGWFRMGQSIFTTNFLHFKHEFYSAIWLRVNLQRSLADPEEQKLLRKNSLLRHTVQKSIPDDEKEILFQKYKLGISFETSPTLKHLLYGKSAGNIYDTWEVALRDGDKLVGIGYFDLGKSSAAGIISVYDPDYRKYSLGRYLIYLKMRFAREQGFTWFYPGYFVPGYKFFDYKLNIGRNAIEYFDVITSRWNDISRFSTSPLSVMLSRLAELKDVLDTYRIESRLFRYEFFDANLFPELKDAELFDYPVFLNCFPFHEEVVNPLIVFDLLTGNYRLYQCVSLWTSNLPPAVEGVYSYHLLKVEFEYFNSPVVEEMARKLVLEVKE